MADDNITYSSVASALPSEITTQWVNQLFKAGATGPDNFVSKGLGYLNLALLVVTIAFLLIDLLRQTSRAANEGEMGGRGAGSSWQPLRWVFALAATIPISGGLSGLQLFILWVAGMAGSFATAVWQSLTAVVVSGGATIIGLPPVSQDYDLINTIVKAAACAEIYNTKSVQGGTGVALTRFQTSKVTDLRSTVNLEMQDVSEFRSFTSGPIEPPSTNVIFGYASTIGGVPSGVCGGLSLPNLPNAKNGATAILPSQVADPSKNPFLGAIQAKSNALSAIAGDAENLGKTLARGLVGGATPPQDGGAAELSALYQKYASSVKQPLQQAISAVSASAEGQRWSSAAKTSSWVSAGSWYLDLSAIGALVARASSATLTIDSYQIPGVWGSSSTQSRRDGDEKLIAINAAINDLSKKAGADVPSNNGGDTASMNWLTRFLTPTVNSYDGTSPGGAFNANPLASLNSYGWGLIGIAGPVLLTSYVVQGFDLGTNKSLPIASLFGAGKGLAIASEILKAVTPAAWIVLGAGLFLAFWVPLRAWVEFTFAIIGWLMLIAVAVIGSGVIVLGIIRGDEDELLGRSFDKLLAVLLHIFLLPVMAVFFLVAAMGIFTLVVGFISWSIGPIMASLTDGTLAGIGWVVSLIATPLIITIMIVVAAEKVFGLITSGPDRVMGYFQGVEGTGAAGATDGVSNKLIGFFRSARGSIQRQRRFEKSPGDKGKGSNDEVNATRTGS